MNTIAEASTTRVAQFVMSDEQWQLFDDESDGQNVQTRCFEDGLYYIVDRDLQKKKLSRGFVTCEEAAMALVEGKENERAVRIKLKDNLPIDEKYGMRKGRICDVIRPGAGDHYGVKWWVRGDTGEDVGILGYEATVVEEVVS